MPNGQNPTPKKKPPYNDYAKYSSMALQMAVTIAIGVYGGIKLDEYLELKKFPVFTITFSLLSVVGAIYISVKDILKKK